MGYAGGYDEEQGGFECPLEDGWCNMLEEANTADPEGKVLVWNPTPPQLAKEIARPAHVRQTEHSPPPLSQPLFLLHVRTRNLLSLSPFLSPSLSLVERLWGGGG